MAQKKGNLKEFYNTKLKRKNKIEMFLHKYRNLKHFNKAKNKIII
jgi:hypothetical protein